MREIKFRAFYQNKVWDVESLYIADEYCTLNGGSIYGTTVNVKLNDCQLIQYTGLTDKNGVEIYEGHIVDFLGHRLFVVFERGAFRLKSKDDAMAEDLLNGLQSSIEVIGNIHENPELLES